MSYTGPRSAAGRAAARHAVRPDSLGALAFVGAARGDTPRDAPRQDPRNAPRSAPRSAPRTVGPGPHRTDGNPPAPPTTLSLVISRRARREAAAAAEAASVRPDPRLETIERVLAGVQVGTNVFVLGLSVVGWLWLAALRPAVATAGRVAAGSTGAVSDTAAGSALAYPVLQPLAAMSGATLVLVMLATCLLMAPVVNPFYAPPPGRRLLHTSTTLLFGVLAVSTVAVIAGAAR